MGSVSNSAASRPGSASPARIPPMHRRQRSRSRERRHDDDGATSAGPGGILQFRKPTSESEKSLDSSFHYASLVQENSFTPKFRQSSAMKTSKLQMKMLIDEEVSKDVKTRQSPSVIARLMGLDSFPPAPRGVNKQPKNIGYHSQTAQSVDSPHRRSTDDLPELKDVFEVLETTKAKKHNKTKARTETSWNAKHLSTDESHHSSNKLNDDSSNDLFLEFLQEPRSLFMKHLNDMNYSPPSPCSSQIKVLKPAKCNKSVRTQPFFESEKDSGSFGEDRSSGTRKLSKPVRKGTTEVNIRPTRIVILKPSLGKVHNMEGAVSLNGEFFQSGCRMPGTFQDSGIWGLHSQGSSEVSGYRSDNAREIAREVTKQMRRTVSHGAQLVVESESNHPYFAETVNREAFHRSLKLHDDWNHAFSLSRAHSTPTPVSREARKCLSDRWKMTRLLPDKEPVISYSSTLGEMPGRPKASNESTARNNIHASSGFSLDISSNDGWKDGKSRNSARSKSLPSSPVACGPKSSNRHRSGRASGRTHFIEKDGSVIRRASCGCERIHFPCLDGEESMLPERDIHVNSEMPSSGANVVNLAEEKTTYPEQFNDAFSAQNHPVNSSAIPAWQHVTKAFLTQRKETTPQSTTTLENEELAAQSPDDLVIQEEPREMESESPLRIKAGERPSPVSVLYPPLEEAATCSGGFERISADLQELRMQLQLLKMESADTFNLSNEDSCDEAGPHQAEETSLAYRNEEERDFCYLLDMLIDLDLHVENHDKLLRACYSLDSPVDPAVFDKLEKKYNKLVLWSRSERRLLFDVTNCVVSDIICSRTVLRPTLIANRVQHESDGERYVEHVWRAIVGTREGNTVGDLGWFCLETGDCMVGRELVSMMHEDLLEEIVADFVL